MIGAVLSARTITLVVLMAAPAAHAQSPTPEPAPRLVLALSGGGARGIAHVGVLRALEENGIAVDAVAGTSMGALVGGLYASGYRASELRTLVSAFDWNGVYTGRGERRLSPPLRRRDDDPVALSLGLEPWKVLLPPSALSDYTLNRFLIRHLAGRGFEAGGDFDRLPIPFRAVAARLDNAERVVLSHGDLPRAVRASLSLPVIFPPVDWEGTLLVDGGVADNLPVGVARSLGGDVVLAVDVSSPPLEPSQWRTLAGVGAQVTDALIEAQNRMYREKPDFEVRPELGRHAATDYSDLDGLMESGYRAALAVMGPLKERLGLRPPPSSPSPRPPFDGTRVAEVAVKGNLKTRAELIRRTFNMPAGRPFDLEAGLRGLDRLFSTRLFDTCWMGLEPAGGGAMRILLSVSEGARGTLGLNAGYDEPAKAHGLVRLRERNALSTGETLEALWSTGDELTEVRLGADSDRPFLPFLGYALGADWREERPRFFRSGVLVDRARFDRRDLVFSLTSPVLGADLLQAGMALGTVETKARPGLPYLPATDETRRLFARYGHDSLDDLYFPNRGWRLDLALDESVSGLGATRDYARGELRMRLALPAGSVLTVEAEVMGGLSARDLPVYDWFRLGGPVLVPGLHSDELWGPQAAGAGAALCLRLDSIRVRARAGAGGVWPTRAEIRLSSLKAGFGVGVVYPTRFGPLGVDWGITTEGRSLWSFTIGYP